MEMDPRRCIFLTGAPDATALIWDDQQLSKDFDTPVKRFLGQQDNASSAAPDFRRLSSISTAVWRKPVISDDARFLNSASPTDSRPCCFLPAPSGHDRGEIDDDFENFLEHSFALLDHLDSSQIVSRTRTSFEEDAETSFTSTEPGSLSHLDVSYVSLPTNNITSTDHAFEVPQALSSVDLTFHGVITDLDTLPSSSHIHRISPQTITVNLLVGIISIATPRTVHLRNRPRCPTMEIVEVLFGDHSRAGFSISFWLVPRPSGNDHNNRHNDEIYSWQNLRDDDLRAELRQLKSGDILLIRNVALSSFRGVVYGQSLGRRRGRCTTSIMLVDDARMGEGATWVLQEKLKKVQMWRDDFVGVGKRREELGPEDADDRPQRKRQRIEELPPDTPI